MDRRRVAAVIVLAFLAGAAFAHAWPALSSRSSIDDRRFTASSSGEFGSVSDSPRVALNRSERRVTVSGQLLVGSPLCSRARLGHVEYHETADALTVLVTAGDRGLIGEFCPDGGGANEYELVLEFDDRLPETIVAVERDSRGNRTQTIVVA